MPSKIIGVPRPRFRFTPSRLLVELDADDAEKMMRLIDRLEDLDDVQAVYSNADISDEILEGLD